MVPTGASVEEFLDGVFPVARAEDARALIASMSRLTGEAPAMWGPWIIGFGVSHLRDVSGRRVDVPDLAFSPRRTALTLYLSDGVVAHRETFDRLGSHRESKGCAYIARLSSIDLAVLEEILIASRDAVRAMDVGTAGA